MTCSHDAHLDDALEHIDVSRLNYDEWIALGAAMKREGYTVERWDEISRLDSQRYVAGECEEKWEGFGESDNPATGGTIVHLAQKQGWTCITPKDAAGALDIDAYIGGTVDANAFEDIGIEPHDPALSGEQQLAALIETMFGRDEIIGYVVESRPVTRDDGTVKHLPANKGVYVRTAGEILDGIASGGSLQDVIGDYDPEGGAWLRVNPLDGGGASDRNVARFGHVLVESDTVAPAIVKRTVEELNLPVAAMVFSGAKSLHVIVQVGAADKAEYRKRVGKLLHTLAAAGLDVDPACKNPSRLFRMPGVMRDGQEQFLVALRSGASSWEAWESWCEEQADDLPPAVCLADYDPDDLPPLKSAVIEGLLRHGHKMSIVGRPKVGKSLILSQLTICLGCGIPFLGHQCVRSKVLYVNFELDDESVLARFDEIRRALGLGWDMENIYHWGLRGLSRPLDKLVHQTIRRAKSNGADVIVFDPVYKMLAGDENSAAEMAAFCNWLDYIARETDCSVVFAHHQSKSAMSYKHSSDRGSGSNVFGRDPDAIVDLSCLDLDAKHREKLLGGLLEDAIDGHMTDAGLGATWASLKSSAGLGIDDGEALEATALSIADDETADKIAADCARIRSAGESIVGVEIDSTLREFRSGKPVKAFRDWPIFKLDERGILADCATERR